MDKTPLGNSKDCPCEYGNADYLHELILLNDDVNTFDYVIESLIQVCDHSPEQAEQCALLTHSKGRCVVKTSALNVVERMGICLSNKGLLVKIN